LLAHRGFPTRWINWITSLLSSSTSMIMLNGVPLQPIKHSRGLRQVTPCPLSSSSLPLTLWAVFYKRQRTGACSAS
jgi:hypothetical protein